MAEVYIYIYIYIYISNGMVILVSFILIISHVFSVLLSR